MNLSYFDLETLTENLITKGTKKLQPYRDDIKKVTDQNDSSRPEYSLVYTRNPDLHDKIEKIKFQFKGIKHLILVGIGGSSLGTEAIHKVLDHGKVELHTLDAISAYNINLLLIKLKSVKSCEKIAVCVISKSGSTAETLVNASVLLSALEEKYTKEIYRQTIFIGNSKTEFLKTGKRLGVNVVEMPEIIGGRYSVGTEVGLIPLALLGHDVDTFMSGLQDALADEFESLVAESAVRLSFYINKNYRSYNFFAFEPRLDTLGAWYRQLFAESIGKEFDLSGKPVTKGFIPTISTPVELHSIGQLYLSNFAGVYTDFVTFDDDAIDFKIPKKGIAKSFAKFDVEEVATAIYGGVVAAYQERKLPYRSVIFTDNITYSLGLFMGMRMLETMYLANLMNLNAFDQPNVELYKLKTREILGL